MPAALRWLLLLAFVLAAMVVGISSGLRLAANGIGCSPWPACYGRAGTADAVNDAPLARAARLTHRLAASAFALVAVALVAVGWRRWQTPGRAAAVVLLAVTAQLAWIGRYTPSPLPAVTLINVVGGFALLASLAFLWARSTAPTVAADDGTTRAVGLLLLFAMALQAGGGALISARLAGDACAAGCGNLWPAGAAVLWHPLQAGAAADLLPYGGEPLQLLHRFGGLVLALACAITALTLRPADSRWPRAALLAALVTAALGFVVAAPMPTLPVAVLHALAAAVLCASFAALAAVAGQQEKSR